MGLPGSHVIHGPFQGFGRGEMPDVLVQWATGFGVLHALSPVLAPAVRGSELVGIKFFFGSNAGQDTAEVRIASVADPLGSAALMQLPCRARKRWPTFAPSRWSSIAINLRRKNSQGASWLTRSSSWPSWPRHTHT